jgi:hypothetical protein
MKLNHRERLISKLHMLIKNKRIMCTDEESSKSLLLSYIKQETLTHAQWKYIETICKRSMK